MSDEEPPWKRSRYDTGPSYFTARRTNSEIKVKLKETLLGRKKLVIQHPSLAHATHCDIRSEVDKLDFCYGDLQYVTWCSKFSAHCVISVLVSHTQSTKRNEGSINSNSNLPHSVPPQAPVPASGATLSGPTKSSLPAAAAPAPTAITQTPLDTANGVVTIVLENQRETVFQAVVERRARVESILQLYAQAHGLDHDRLMYAEPMCMC